MKTPTAPSERAKSATAKLAKPPPSVNATQSRSQGSAARPARAGASPIATKRVLIDNLSSDVLALAQAGTRRSFRAGALLIQEGDISSTVYVLLQGQVRVYSNDLQGRELVYGTVQAGDFFGEMSLDGGARSASVATLVPSVCAVVPAEAVWRAAAERPTLARELIHRIIRRARDATQVARGLALLDVYGRLVLLLQGLAGEPDASGHRVTRYAMTQLEIGQRIGASREMVSKQLKDLAEGGYLKMEGRRIRLLKKLPARY